ncbi:hypothetical protein KKD52_03280 [Myxococcota bacterium]|nr:hypothetical protein [Myxococcota bacterium]
MKEHLPFQARWTVKVLQWLLSREVSLEEMLQDEDVLSGVVTYLTKKVSVENELPGQKENLEKVSTMEKELDFVRCRLQGADQQRKNEVQDLENRNSELREEVVKLTHKVRAAEKEILEANFASGTTKAALKKMEEELRDLRKKLEKTEQELAQRNEELAQAQARHTEIRAELDLIHASLARSEKEFNNRLILQTSHWEDEKNRLLFMLEERDNALSEAREGQAAATREIVSVSRNLEDNLERLALLEVEAVQKGVPMVKVGYEPVVGEKAARAVAEKKLKKEEDTPAPKASRRKSALPDFDPISAVVGFSTANMFELSDDARYTEIVNLDVESIPEPNAHPVKEKNHQIRKEKTEKPTEKPAEKKTTGKSVEKTGTQKPARKKGERSAPQKAAEKPAEKAAPPKTTEKQAEKAAPPKTTEKQAEKAAPPKTAEKPAEKAAPPKTAEKQAEKAAPPKTTEKQAEKAAPLKTIEKPAQQPAKNNQRNSRNPQQPQNQARNPQQPQSQGRNPQKGAQPAANSSQPGSTGQQPGSGRSRKSRPRRRPRHSPGESRQ